ncbi:MAG: hypothetical protein IPO67_31345 [Deltaproteobacteria bacterium]|nr:hypothetical protein [Deltaproteobacteria bacterium]
MGGPTLPNELRALYTFRRDKPFNVGVGLLVISQPIVTFEQVLLTSEGAQVVVEAPSFGAVGARGRFVRLVLAEVSPSVGRSLPAARLDNRPRGERRRVWGLGGSVGLPIGPIEVILGAELGGLKGMKSQPGPWLFPQVVGGVQWSR